MPGSHPIALENPDMNDTTPTDTVPARASEQSGTEKLAPGSALVIGLLMGTTFLVLLNEMLLGVALPTLIDDLGITPSTGQWLTTGYLLTLAVLIPATGYVMRRLHMRTIFLSALTLFIVGTAISAAAPGFAVLLTGRIVQAAGTAVFAPLLMTTAMRLIPESRRGSIMALVTAVPAIAPAVGPGVSGLVLSLLTWRWLFILVLPVAAVAWVVGAVKLKNITTPQPATLDIVSLVLSALGFGCLIFGLASIGESASGHAPVPPAIPIAVGILGVAAFAYRQVMLRRGGREPFLDMRIFRTSSFVMALLVMVFIGLNAFGIGLVLPLVLTGSLGLDTLSVGLFLVPGGVVIALVSAAGGRVYDRFGARPLVVPGAVIWAASIWCLSSLDDSHSVWLYLAAYLVVSASQAMMWAPVTTLALSSLRAELYPYGSAAFATAQQLAGAAGGAVLVSAYTIGANAADPGALSAGETAAAGQTAFTAAFVIALAAVVGALFLGDRSRPDSA